MHEKNIKSDKSYDIYQYIRHKQVVSKQDIVVGLNLSLPTVTKNLGYLQELKLIDTSSKITNTGGRNATAYIYLERARAAIGIYLTKSHINGVAVDLSGRIIDAYSLRKPLDLNDDVYLQKIGEVVKRIKKNTGVAITDILGVGIAVQGFISDDGEYIVMSSVSDIGNQTREQIAKYIPFETHIYHDARMGGYAEVWDDDNIRNAFYISLNEGVGGTIIVDNNIDAVAGKKSGEVGNMLIEGGSVNELCNFTNLSSYTGGDLDLFFMRLEAKDAGAKKLWDTYLSNLAIVVHNIRMIFDEPIILGGAVGAYMEGYMDELANIINAKNPFGDDAERYIIPCKYKKETVAVGAAITNIERFFMSL
ncbi:MAG: ROK family protein [Suipraeoptans sp.]